MCKCCVVRNQFRFALCRGDEIVRTKCSLESRLRFTMSQFDRSTKHNGIDAMGRVKSGRGENGENSGVGLGEKRKFQIRKPVPEH